jgi:hypothetical protein
MDGDLVATAWKEFRMVHRTRQEVALHEDGILGEC